MSSLLVCFFFSSKGKCLKLGNFLLMLSSAGLGEGMMQTKLTILLTLSASYFQVWSVTLLTLFRPTFIYCELSNCETTKAGVSYSAILVMSP